MNISTAEIKRLTAQTSLQHYQYADMDSRRQAVVAAREAYRKAMAGHGYEQPDNDAPAALEWLRAAGRRLRMLWLGMVRSEG